MAPAGRYRTLRPHLLHSSPKNESRHQTRRICVFARAAYRQPFCPATIGRISGVHRNESAGGVPVAAIGLFRCQITVSLIIGELLMIHATVVAIMVLALG